MLKDGSDRRGNFRLIGDAGLTNGRCYTRVFIHGTLNAAATNASTTGLPKYWCYLIQY